ncbi:nad binding rossmann fold [Diplodia corticola]|uniref:Nad binding rossmann fold n=1 Tax=Diplodia corticola TaxID=236234 RepID=A0A1J9QQN1_9PEZI|nr:nad binding rossmann fold [Diplodia corticola]OJD30330.1 nad binding rossmann fold [Diplodia corticola]
MAPPQKLRVGIIGAGEVAQVIHLPTLALLSHLYTVTTICDLSPTLAAHCAAKFHIPTTAPHPASVWTSPAVDVVFVLAADECHAAHCVAALAAGKRVFVEKPLTLSVEGAGRVVEADRMAGGGRTFVGYMRRYAPSFVGAFKREVVAGVGEVLYARVRDFSGPNGAFVGGSGTFPVKAAEGEGVAAGRAAGEERKALLEGLVEEAFPGKGVVVADQAGRDERYDLCRFLGSLGSHDLSLMREVLGSPERVDGVSANHPFYSAIFAYRNKEELGGRPFAVTYESGIDGVPEFDAHLAVYGRNKRVEIRYDSPYVKGLPIKVRTVGVNEHGEVETKEVLSSYEDAYTAELKEMHRCFTEGAPIKTTPEDAMEDLKLFDMIYKKYDESVKR